MKRHAPATERNREPICKVLTEELPDSGLLLEIAAGSGEHAVYFAARFSHLHWQPTDPDPEALASITAYREEALLDNLIAPLELDAASDAWPVDRADAILCINMTHIGPPEATAGLFAGAGRVLLGAGPLIVYGPFIEEGVETAPSNLAFDASLQARDPRWGLRDVKWLDDLAGENGLQRTRRVEMPANNLVLVYRRG